MSFNCAHSKLIANIPSAPRDLNPEHAETGGITDALCKGASDWMQILSTSVEMQESRLAQTVQEAA